MKDLTKGSPRQLIIAFALPIFIGSLFQLFYNLIDIRIIGMTLKKEALAAVGATSTMNNLIVGFLIGLTNGFAILTARDFGAQDEDAMRKDIAGTLLLGVIFAIGLTALSVGFLPQILHLLRMPEALMEQGISYIRIILLGMMTALLYNVCASTLRAVGDTVAALIFLIIAAGLNIVLDLVMICILRKGVAGAAWATVISQLAAAVMCYFYMRHRYPQLHLQLSDFKLSSKRLWALLTSGISMGLMQSLVSLGTVALQGAINSLGTDIIAAHTGARKITELLMLPFSALGMTMATYCSQNKGAGKMQRVKEGLKEALGMSFIWCLLVILISYTLSPWLVEMVTATTDRSIIETASLYLKVDTLLYFVTALITVLRNALQGMGDRTTPIFSSFIELAGKVLVVIFLTPRLQYMGIILAEPIVWVLMVIPLIVAMYHRLKNEETQKIAI